MQPAARSPSWPPCTRPSSVTLTSQPRQPPGDRRRWPGGLPGWSDPAGLRITNDHAELHIKVRPSGHIMPDHVGDRGELPPVLAPHDHLHIKQIRMFAARPGGDLVHQVGLVCTHGWSPQEGASPRRGGYSACPVYGLAAAGDRRGLWGGRAGRLAAAGQWFLRPVGRSVCGWLPGGGEAGCCGVGVAVVPGQGSAGFPGPAGDGVVAYLAAGDRKLGDGHGEAPGTWLARHLL